MSNEANKLAEALIFSKTKGDELVYIKQEFCAGIIAAMRISDARIKALEGLLSRYQNGHKGGCYACETVGEKNIELEAENAKLQEALMDALECIEGAADGHGVDFYAYAKDIKALKGLGNE